MLLSLAAVIVGLTLLVWSADRFIFGSAGLARAAGISPLVIGMTIVGFGTSAPELFVSTLASLQDNPGIAIGNVIGSNLCNTALIVGLCALIRPIDVRSSILRRELPICLAATLGVLALCLDNQLTRGDATLLALGFGGFMIWMLRAALSGQADALALELDTELPPPLPTGRALLWIVVGLVLLVASSQLLIWGAVQIARTLGVSDLVIGLTIVAIGTSLPELAASVAGLLKGEDDIAIGNILGSNLFNLLGILQAPAWIAPGTVPAGVLTRDLPAMVGVTVLLYLFAWGFRGRPPRINRWEGAVLMTIYLAYTLILIRTSSLA
jgi:cation:H+ antiporter